MMGLMRREETFYNTNHLARKTGACDVFRQLSSNYLRFDPLERAREEVARRQLPRPRRQVREPLVRHVNPGVAAAQVDRRGESKLWETTGPPGDEQYFSFMGLGRGFGVTQPGARFQALLKSKLNQFNSYVQLLYIFEPRAPAHTSVT
jgi:hypothetical protein